MSQDVTECAFGNAPLTIGNASKVLIDNSCECQIAEAVVFDRALNSAEQTEITNYFQRKLESSIRVRFEQGPQVGSKSIYLGELLAFSKD